MPVIQTVSRVEMLTVRNSLTTDHPNLLAVSSLLAVSADPHPFAYVLYLVSACRSGAWSPAAELAGAAPRNRRRPSPPGWPSAPRTDFSPPPEVAGSSWHQPCTAPALAAGGAAGSPCLSTPEIVIITENEDMGKQRRWRGLDPERIKRRMRGWGSAVLLLCRVIVCRGSKPFNLQLLLLVQSSSLSQELIHELGGGGSSVSHFSTGIYY